MRSVHLQTNDTVHDIEAQRALSSMPDGVRQLAFGDGPNPQALASALLHRWRDGQWRAAVDTRHMSLWEATQLARRVIDLDAQASAPAA